jgi:DNA polymerase-1
MTEAKAFLDAYWEAYPKYKQYVDSLVVQVEADGGCRNWAGRWRTIPKATNRNEKNRNMRLAMNTPIQGGALDVAKQACVDLLPLLRLGEEVDIHPFEFLHDEVGFERGKDCPDDLTWQVFLDQAVEIMEAANPFMDVDLPVTLSIASSWGDCK